MPVRLLESKHPGTPALLGDAGPFGRDEVIGRIGEVVHDLPADRRVTLK